MAFISAAVSCKKRMDDRNVTELDTRKSPNLTRTSRLPLLVLRIQGLDRHNTKKILKAGFPVQVIDWHDMKQARPMQW